MIERELLGFRALMKIIPKVQDLRIEGFFHISVGEPLEHYLCGTIGFCEETNE